MITLKNNSRIKAIKGYIVRQDNRKIGYLYVEPNATIAIGVIVDDTHIAKTGEDTLVYVSGYVKKGQTIRSFKYGDVGKPGMGFAVEDGYTEQFLQIGTALESGRNTLVKASLLIANQTTTESSTTPTFTGQILRWNNTTKSYDLTSDVKIGTSSNYTQFSSDGSMQFVGNATNWDDIRIIPNVFDVPGGTDPDIISYQPGGSGATLKVYAFAKGDEGFFTVQLPHSYKEGSNLYAHLHWTPGPRGNEENGNVVQWRLDYTIAGHGSNFAAVQTASLADACDGTDHKHQMTGAATISGSGLTISSQMFGRVYRWDDVSDTWAGTGANLPIFIEFDIHYEINSIGSKTVTAK